MSIIAIILLILNILLIKFLKWLLTCHIHYVMKPNQSLNADRKECYLFNIKIN